MHDTVIINIPIQKIYVRHLSGERFGIFGDLHMYGVKTACEIRFDPTTGTTSHHDLKHPFESLPSSYAHMAMKFYHEATNTIPYVSLNASPKFIQGHNICGTDDIFELVCEMLGVFKDSYSHFWMFLDIANAEISRVDFTYSVHLSYDDMMTDVINLIGRISTGQRKPDPARNKFDSTRYWGKANNRVGYCKLYGKDDEVSSTIKGLERKARLGNIQAQHLLDDVFTQELQAYAKNLLRFEATNKKQCLVQQGIPTNLWQFIKYQRQHPNTSVNLWNKWFNPILQAMQGEIMTNVDDSEILELCKKKLFTVNKKGQISHTQANNAYRFYVFLKQKGYIQAKEFTNKATFNRNVKALCDIGIPKTQ